MNPWANVPENAPFVLDEDCAAITAFNARHSEYSKHWIHTGRIPEPRLGPVNAGVVLLQLNASYDQATKEIPLTPAQVAKGRSDLADEKSLHPCIAEPNVWWDRAFKQPISHFGRRRVAGGVCSIEYFAYPSKHFGHRDLALSSQDYQFSLVRDAISRGAIIIVTRGWALWVTKVPGLALLEGKSVFRTKNPRRVTVSAGNLPEGAYRAVSEAI